MRGLRERLLTLLLAALVATATAFVYSNSFTAQFVLDDKLIVPFGRPFDLENVVELFREDAWAASGSKIDVYRPLLMLTVLHDVSRFGRDGTGYHFTNIGLHVAATLLLFGLLLALARHVSRRGQAAEEAPPRGLRRPEIWAALGALLFGVHPIHTEAVDSIFNRSEPLACLFVFGGLWWLWSWIERRPWLAWSGAAVLYFLGLLCRESAATFPALAVILLGLLRLEGSWRSRARRLLPVFALAVPLSGYFVMRHAALSRPAASIARAISDDQLAPLTVPQKLESTTVVLGQFARMIAWPHPLRASYDDFVVERAWAWGLLHLALVGLALALLRRAPAVAAGVGFFYVALSPSTRFFTDLDVAVMIAERYVYLPSAALSILVAGAGATVVARPSQRRWLGLVAGGTAIALLLSAAAVLGRLTYERNVQWHDEEKLWTADLQASPTNGNAWMQLTTWLLGRKQPARVQAMCDEAMRLAPREAQVFNNCALAAWRLGKAALAEERFLKSIALGAGPVGHANLARLYAHAGRRAKMQSHFERAIELERDMAMKHVRRGELYYRLFPEEPARARAEIEAALAIDPKFAPARQWLVRLGGAPDHERAEPGE